MQSLKLALHGIIILFPVANLFLICTHPKGRPIYLDPTHLRKDTNNEFEATQFVLIHTTTINEGDLYITTFIIPILLPCLRISECSNVLLICDKISQSYLNEAPAFNTQSNISKEVLIPSQW